MAEGVLEKRGVYWLEKRMNWEILDAWFVVVWRELTRLESRTPKSKRSQSAEALDRVIGRPLRAERRPGASILGSSPSRCCSPSNGPKLRIEGSPSLEVSEVEGCERKGWRAVKERATLWTGELWTSLWVFHALSIALMVC